MKDEEKKAQLVAHWQMLLTQFRKLQHALLLLIKSDAPDKDVQDVFRAYKQAHVLLAATQTVMQQRIPDRTWRIGEVQGDYHDKE